jgi:hypothetical protein
LHASRCVVPASALRRRRRLLDDELNAEVAARAHDSIVGLFFLGMTGD